MVNHCVQIVASTFEQVSITSRLNYFDELSAKTITRTFKKAKSCSPLTLQLVEIVTHKNVQH